MFLKNELVKDEIRKKIKDIERNRNKNQHSVQKLMGYSKNSTKKDL
jgi:hypothetical protein